MGSDEVGITQALSRGDDNSRLPDTTEFVHESEVQRDALGMSDLAPVVIDHPLSTFTEQGIDERAQASCRPVGRDLG